MLRGLTRRYIQEFEKEQGFDPRRLAQALYKTDQGVMGIGYGWRRDDVGQTEEPGILLFVADRDTLGKPGHPNEVGGTSVSRVVTGWAAPVAKRTDRNTRPVKGGVAIGTTPNGDSGTLACRVFRDEADGRVFFVLSCAHVLLGPATEIGHEIVQPGLAYDGSPEGNTIARLERSVEIRFDGTFNTVDAAIGRVEKELVRDGIVSLGAIRSWRRTEDIPVGLEVKKSGIMKPYVRAGKVEAIEFTGTWPYPAGNAWFTRQIVTSALAQPGDSGSLLLAKDKSAVGLVVASSDLHTFACPIEAVQDALDVKVADEVWAEA